MRNTSLGSILLMGSILLAGWGFYGFNQALQVLNHQIANPCGFTQEQINDPNAGTWTYWCPQEPWTIKIYKEYEANRLPEIMKIGAGAILFIGGLILHKQSK